MNLPHVLLFNECSIRVYQLFADSCHKCRNIAINEFYIFPIMLALCLMTHYAQNYAGIIGGSLFKSSNLHGDFFKK